MEDELLECPGNSVIIFSFPIQSSIGANAWWSHNVIWHEITKIGWNFDIYLFVSLLIWYQKQYIKELRD